MSITEFPFSKIIEFGNGEDSYNDTLLYSYSHLNCLLEIKLQISLNKEKAKKTIKMCSNIAEIKLNGIIYDYSVKIPFIIQAKGDNFVFNNIYTFSQENECIFIPTTTISQFIISYIPFTPNYFEKSIKEKPFNALLLKIFSLLDSSPFVLHYFDDRRPFLSMKKKLTVNPTVDSECFMDISFLLNHTKNAAKTVSGMRLVALDLFKKFYDELGFPVNVVQQVPTSLIKNDDSRLVYTFVPPVNFTLMPYIHVNVSKYTLSTALIYESDTFVSIFVEGDGFYRVIGNNISYVSGTPSYSGDLIACTYALAYNKEKYDTYKIPMIALPSFVDRQQILDTYSVSEINAEKISLVHEERNVDEILFMTDVVFYQFDPETCKITSPPLSFVCGSSVLIINKSDKINFDEKNYEFVLIK